MEERVKRSPSQCRITGVSTSVLDCLSARFLLSLPEKQRTSLPSICHRLELAHWFLQDFLIPDIICSFTQFVTGMMLHVPFLRRLGWEVGTILQVWQSFKWSVPTFGAVLFDSRLEQVVLVRSLRGSWGFPKGKLQEEETGVECAAREVLEETGISIGRLINPECFITAELFGRPVCLYIVTGFGRSETMQPRGLGEIAEVRWFPLCCLPSTVSDPWTGSRLGMSAQKLWLVLPFVRKLRLWVEVRKEKDRREVWGEQSQRTGRTKDIFCPETWKNFKLNIGDMMVFTI